MICLAKDCLLFVLADGERVPMSPDMFAFELTGCSGQWLEMEFVRQTTAAVFYYFRHDLGKEIVTLGEFAGVLEKALQTVASPSQAPCTPVTETPCPASPGRYFESDLSRLACESGKACELAFFPRLRDQVRHQLGSGSATLRFRGLRRCVKQLVGARRWSRRCRDLHEDIVAFLRRCVSHRAEAGRVSLIIV